MGAKRLCVVCRVRPPEVPDREQMGRPVKRVCRECHAARIRGDLREILEREKRRLERGGNDGR
jgi:hypothetical protein